MCPWRRHRRAQAAVAREAKAAHDEKKAAEYRYKTAERQVKRALAVQAGLRQEVAKNHFAEELLAAMKRSR